MADSCRTGAKVLSVVHFFFWIAVLLFSFAVRLRLLSVPLERDEGEYAYIAQLMLNGIPPYIHAFTMKLPGVPAFYALFMAQFGHTVEALHTGLLIVDACSTLLLFLLAKKLYNSTRALVSAACFSFLLVAPPVQGSAAHATHFLILFFLASVVITAYSGAQSKSGAFWSGLCAGISIVMKQHAVILIPFLFWFHFFKASCRRPSDTDAGKTGAIALFITGVLTPYALMCTVFYHVGVFRKFWFWTVIYAQKYVSETSLIEGIGNLFSGSLEVIRPYAPLWLVAAAGMYWGVIKAALLDKKFVLLLTVSLFMALCPGLYFRGHYFIILFPLLALALGAADWYLDESPPGLRLPAIRLVVAIVMIGYPVFKNPGYFLYWTPEEIARNQYGNSPFIESLTIAKFIRENTQKNEKILVFGSEPQIYFYSDRVSASGHVYMYGLMENQSYSKVMQQELMCDTYLTRPKLIVLVRNEASWCINEHTDKTLLDWIPVYLRGHYEKVGFVNLGYPSEYFMGADALKSKRRSYTNYVIIYKRKDAEINKS